MIGFGKGVKSERPIIFEIPEDPEKQKASDLLNKEWEEVAANPEQLRELELEQVNYQEPEPEGLPLDDDDIPF